MNLITWLALTVFFILKQLRDPRTIQKRIQIKFKPHALPIVCTCFVYSGNFIIVPQKECLFFSIVHYIVSVHTSVAIVLFCFSLNENRNRISDSICGLPQYLNRRLRSIYSLYRMLYKFKRYFHWHSEVKTSLGTICVQWSVTLRYDDVESDLPCSTRYIKRSRSRCTEL